LSLRASVGSTEAAGKSLRGLIYLYVCCNRLVNGYQPMASIPTRHGDRSRAVRLHRGPWRLGRLNSDTSLRRCRWPGPSPPVGFPAWSSCRRPSCPSGRATWCTANRARRGARRPASAHRRAPGPPVIRVDEEEAVWGMHHPGRTGRR
jgi:hypothetical protein